MPGHQTRLARALLLLALLSLALTTSAPPLGYRFTLIPPGRMLDAQAAGSLAVPLESGWQPAQGVQHAAEHPFPAASASYEATSSLAALAPILGTSISPRLRDARSYGPIGLVRAEGAWQIDWHVGRAAALDRARLGAQALSRVLPARGPPLSA